MASYRLIYFILCQILFVIYSEASQCGLNTTDGRMLVCGAGPTSCERITMRNEDYLLATPDKNMLGLFYNVYAIKICGNYQVGNVTLADATLCQERTEAKDSYVLKFGSLCKVNSSEGLIVYGYNSTGCAGDLSYRFLLINNSSEFSVFHHIVIILGPMAISNEPRRYLHISYLPKHRKFTL